MAATNKSKSKSKSKSSSKSSAAKPATAAPAQPVQPGTPPVAPDAAATSGGASIEAPEATGKVKAEHVRDAFAGFIDAGAETRKALAAELADVDFVATVEDEAAKRVEAAVEAVTGAGRLNRDQAILVARRIRAATSG